MEKTDLISRYEYLKSLVVSRKTEFERLMAFVEGSTAYLTAPASTHYHLCCEQGLLEHSVNVAETMLKIKKVLAPEISDESCVIVALLHDLGKAGTPGDPLYLKNPAANGYRSSFSGRGSPYPYLYNKEHTYLSVPVRSLFLILGFFPLSETECQAICYHDGQYVDDNRSVATHETPLTLLLQYADNWSGFVIEERSA